MIEAIYHVDGEKGEKVDNAFCIYCRRFKRQPNIKKIFSTYS